MKFVIKKTTFFTESAFEGLRNQGPKKVFFQGLGFKGPQRRGVQRMGPLRVCWICDLLRGLYNLIIIEGMNKFEHNIKFVIKSLT